MKKFSMHDAAVSRMLTKRGPLAERPLGASMQKDTAGPLKAKRDADLQKFPKAWRRDPFPF